MSYESVIAEVAKIKEQRGSMYRVEPKDIVPIEFLEAMTVLKAYRGYYGNNVEKKIDEYRDLINYSVFIIDRLQKGVVDIAPRDVCESKPVCFGEYNPKRPLCQSRLCSDLNACRVKTCFGHFRKLDDPDCAACGRTHECYARTITRGGDSGGT